MSERPSYRLPRAIVPSHYALVLEPDLAEASFKGSVDIDAEVLEPTTQVTLNAAELVIGSASVSAGTAGGGPDQQASVTYLDEEEQAVLSLPAELSPGPCRIHLEFSGVLNDKMRGFYRSRYKGADGEDHWLAVTQFEPTDARRAFPCWDEPDFKATFAVTVVADEQLTALSNSKLESEEADSKGTRRSAFASTIKMSTYLLAIAVGPFLMTAPVEVDGVPVRIGYIPGREDMTALAVRASAHALGFLRDYFAIPYPADKLDHIAIPDFAAGAMENLGLVTYRETALLVPPESSQAERERVGLVVAHETAHMWFGDLVTMKWWEGIWLNEAFATFMEQLTTDAFEPSWRIWDGFSIDRAAAMSTDSLRSTRPIEFKVGRPEEAEEMFDVITYEKGASVLRMLERHLGDETFRKGLSYYLDKHKYGNTVTTDLWDALEHVSGRPVTAMMSTWVDQAGHPVITAHLGQNGGGKPVLQLEQRRFVLEAGADDDDDQTWAVPVTVRYGTADGTKHAGTVLEERSGSLELEGDPEWLVVNEAAWGVYRCEYCEPLRQRLVANLDQLDERERVALLADTWASTLAVRAPLSEPVQLWRQLSDDQGPDLWWYISSGLGLLGLVCPEGQLPGLNHLVRTLAGPMFSSLGWGPPPGEPVPPRQARLRARLVTLLGTIGADHDVRTYAAKVLAEMNAGESSVPAELATAIAYTVAAGGGESEWEMLNSLRQKAKTPQDEQRYLSSLTAFEDRSLLGRSVDLAYSGEVRPQDQATYLSGLMSNRFAVAATWQAVEDHWEEMEREWSPKLFLRLLESLPGLAGDPSSASRAVEWVNSHPLDIGGRRLEQAKERLRVNVAFGRRVPDELGELLAALGPPAP